MSNSAELSRSLRKHLGDVTQAELAAKLLVSRNYISQIEAGLKEPSKRLRAQMEEVLTQSANRQNDKVSNGAGEERGEYASLEDQLRADFEQLIAAAQNDPTRLSWILEQMRAHLTPPQHWFTPARPHPNLGTIRPKSEKGQSLPSASPQSRSA